MNSPRLRLGLPWRLPHYHPLNGPHPLVDSFVRGNPLIETVELPAGTPAQPAALQGVLLNLTQQARAIAHEQTGRFIEWLKLGDQLTVEAQADRYDALFLHTTPLYAGNQPWIFHFESFPSLFMPFMFTGETRGLDLRQQGFFAQVRAQLESPACLRIFSHMRGSLEILARTFDSPAIAAKLHHVPLGLAQPPATRWQDKYRPGQRLRILFTNSLHQDPRSFYLRGGHHLLEAFARLRKRFPELELTVLSSVPGDLLQRFTPPDLIGVTWINERVDDDALEQLFAGHQIFALPAAGLHSYSLLRALAYGCVPLVSDAPGYEEYLQGIEDSVLPLRGVRELIYRDEPGGWTSDQYAPYVERSETFVRRLHDLLLENTSLERLHGFAQRNADHARRNFALDASQAAFNRMLAHG